MKPMFFDSIRAAVARMEIDDRIAPELANIPAFRDAIAGVDFGDSQAAMGFLVPQLLRVEAGMYMTRYPATDYAEFMPVDTQGGLWSAGSLYYSGDVAGRPEWFDVAADDMPYADVTRAQFLQENFMAGLGYKWNRGDLERAQQLGINILADKANGASQSAERFIHKVAMLGDGVKFSEGFVNDSQMTVVAATSDITDSSTAANDIAAINAVLQAVETNTRETYRATALAMATSRYNIIATKQLPNTGMSVLQYLQANSVVGQVTIRRTRHLEDAAPGGLPRMIAYANDPDVHRFHLPGGGHQFFAAWQKGPFSWEVPGVLSTGGYELRIPLAKVAADQSAS